MRVRAGFVVLAAAFALAGGCSGSDDVPDADALPSVALPTPTPTPTATPAPTEPACPARTPKRGSFLVELDIMSGNPNPSFFLTRAETRRFKALLREDTTGTVGVDEGPEGLGYRGWLVRGGDSQAAFLSSVDLGQEFRVLGDQTDPDATLAYFLNTALGCRGTFDHVEPYPGTPE